VVTIYEYLDLSSDDKALSTFKAGFLTGVNGV